MPSPNANPDSGRLLPAIALVGRPNVGKSTLFNRLTQSRDALVADFPGLTRDRLYGYARLGDQSLVVIDTGGLSGEREALDESMARQVALAVAEADVVVMLADADAGLTAGDEQVAALMRRSGKPTLLAINKVDGAQPELAVAEFHALGLDDPIALSALRGSGVPALLQRIEDRLPASSSTPQEPTEEGVRLAVVGRPNVGKSTLVNRLLGEERVVTQDQAGTTRDSIAVPFSVDAQRFVLVDTAGIRRRAKVDQTIEKFSVVKALQAVEEADAVMLLLDAQAGITEQDVSLVGLIVERGRALALGINKWDGLANSQRSEITRQLDRQLPFLDFVDTHYISARHGSNIFDLLKSAARAAQAATRDLATARINDVLQAAVQAHPPPVVRRTRVKLSYGHQGGKRPPTIVLHGNQTNRLPGSYRRYLVNCFRRAFKLRGTPIRLQLRTAENPYAGRRNKLTPRQLRRQRRIRSRR